MSTTRYPSGGREQTLGPSPTQLEMLERYSWLDVSELNCTRKQASRWLHAFWEPNPGTRKRLSAIAVSEMLRHGAKERW